MLINKSTNNSNYIKVNDERYQTYKDIEQDCCFYKKKNSMMP